MQTFLPYPSFRDSAACLDRLRLGKQRVEVLQILNALYSGGRWANHPATLMWKGFENALVLYGVRICSKWKKRGYRDSTLEKISIFWEGELLFPWWLEDERFHSAHRAALLFKNYDHYSKFNWPEKPAIDYWWPTKEKL